MIVIDYSDYFIEHACYIVQTKQSLSVLTWSFSCIDSQFNTNFN